MVDKKGQLEVEVIRARGLTQKPGSKSTPGKGKINNTWTEIRNMKYAGELGIGGFLSTLLDVNTFYLQGMYAWTYILVISQLPTACIC